MHPQLATPDKAVKRLAHDTLIHLVRQRGTRPSLVRVAIPEGWDPAAFGRSLANEYGERGLGTVQVMVLPTDGEPRLLSVQF